MSVALNFKAMQRACMLMFWGGQDIKCTQGRMATQEIAAKIVLAWPKLQYEVRTKSSLLLPCSQAQKSELRS